MKDRNRARLGAIAMDRTLAGQLVEVLVHRDLADAERPGSFFESRRNAFLPAVVAEVPQNANLLLRKHQVHGQALPRTAAVRCMVFCVSLP